MANYVGGGLRKKIENPVKFQWAVGGGGVAASFKLRHYQTLTYKAQNM